MAWIIGRRIKTAGESTAKPITFLKKHWKTIVYYIAVAAAMAAIACAAEGYRARPTRESSAPAAAPAETAEEAPVEEETVFALPEQARLIRESMREGVRNEELGQWEWHEGEDYAFPDGNALSFSNGAVERVSAEDGCIDIRSADVLLRYRCIEPKETLREGDTVEAGEIIGICGDTLRGEGHMEKHLHLEVYKAGSAVDFTALAE